MSKSQAQLEGASTRTDQCGLLGSLGRGKGQKLGTLDADRRKGSKWRLLIESNLHPSTAKTCGGQQPGWLRLQILMLSRFQPPPQEGLQLEARKPYASSQAETFY